MDARQKQAYRMAQDLLSKGSTDAAVKVLADADILDEAARILSSEWRHAEAGRLILSNVGVDMGSLAITATVSAASPRGQPRHVRR